MQQNCLSREAFASAIKHGRGRAVLHVRQFGLEGVADIVLAACLENLSYDRQCESGRAPWIFDLFKDAPEYPLFSAAIVAALAVENEDNDLEQICELAALMGRQGDNAAARALRTFVLGQSFNADDDQYGDHALVFLDGVDAAIEMARRYGALLRSAPDEYVPSLRTLTEGLDIQAVVEAKLRQLTDTDHAIRTYWEKEQGDASPQRDRTPQEWEAYKQEARRELPLEKILANASAKLDNFPGEFRRFGLFATQADLDTVLQHLITEVDEEVCQRLLWVFRKAPLPELHAKIWALAESRNDDVRAAALLALAQSSDPRIGDLGRKKLQSPMFSKNDSEFFELFIKNYQPGDEGLMMAALNRLDLDDDVAHDFGYSIRNICEENNSPAFAELLCWLYETNPCTLCRHSAVQSLIEIGNPSSEIMAECLHDADEETRKLAQEYLATPSAA